MTAGQTAVGAQTEGLRTLLPILSPHPDPEALGKHGIRKGLLLSHPPSFQPLEMNQKVSILIQTIHSECPLRMRRGPRGRNAGLANKRASSCRPGS